MERVDPRLHAELLELAELAALEVLEPDEHRRLAAHLRAGCAECAERYDQGARALAALALAGPDAQPFPDHREKLLSAVAGPRAPRALPTAPRGGWRVAVPAFAAGVALLLAAGSLFTARRAERDAADVIRLAREELDARLGERDTRLAAVSARLSDFEAAVAQLGEERVRQVTLVGDAAFGDASARVVVDPAGHQVLLLASRLPPAPPGRTYQLWVIVSGAPESLGVFDSDAGGRALHVESRPLELADEFSVAISVEPAGGVHQPTGPIVLASH
jgi:anti-sigma-K factor RskA